MLTCISCNQVLDKGEKFCHLCGGVGVAVYQNIRQMPEQKRDIASQTENELNIIKYGLWIVFSSSLQYLAALSVITAIGIAYRTGLMAPLSRHHRAMMPPVEPLSPTNIMLIVVFVLLLYTLNILARRIIIMLYQEYKNTDFSKLSSEIIAILTIFVWYLLEMNSQITNNCFIISTGTAVAAIIGLMFTMGMPPSEDELSK